MPTITERVVALQRDVTQLTERAARTAAQAPPGSLTPASPVVDQVFDRAVEIRLRGERLASSPGFHELVQGPASRRTPAQQAALDAVAGAMTLERTATQLLGTGPRQHAPITVSSVAPHSARSARTWAAATAGSGDVPDVRIVGSIPPPAARLVADRLENLPLAVVRQLDAQGLRSTLFSGRLTDVYGFRHLRGVQPRGWPDGSTWDQVPGVATVRGMAANPNRERRGSGHGTESLALHEIGHEVDTAMAGPGEHRLSSADRWMRGPQREARASGSLTSYVTRYPEEWFAEAFMRYTRTPATNAALERWYPKTFRFLQRELGDPRFD